MKLGTFLLILKSSCENGVFENLEDGVKKLKELGISYYEVSADMINDIENEKYILSQIETNGAKIGNLYFKNDITSIEDDTIENMLNITEKKIEQCKRINCPLLMPVVKIKSKEVLQTLDYEEKIVEYFNKASALAIPYGVKIVFENSSLPSINSFSIEDVVLMLNKTKDVGYILDTGNFWFLDEDASSVIKSYANRIENVHIKDILPFDEEHFKETSQYVEFSALGSGDIKIEKIINLLKEYRFNNGITIELNGYEKGYEKLISSLKFLKSIGVHIDE